MSNKKLLEAFHKDHPFAAQVGIEKLYKFMSFNPEHPEYLEQLLVGLRLYHALPQEFNDPFECKPHWQWPDNVHEIKGLREELFKIAKRNGASKKESKEFASQSMLNKKETEEKIKRILVENYQKIRVCSFSISNENILLWSHYAKAHNGICIAFDASTLPLGACMKVKYQDEYPSLELPIPHDARGFKPALIKSSSWEYEDEYRSFLYPNAERQHENDGESYFLSAESITDIYLGSEILDDDEKCIYSFVEKSKIRPNLWKAILSENTFSITFKKIIPDA